jgi:hypothetical protein
VSTVKATLRDTLPKPIWSALATSKRYVLGLPDELSWWLGVQGRESRDRLRALKDRHLGQRCFIIGNGPSLRKTDLSLLENEYTFGLNRIYLLFDQLGFATSYHVTVNALVAQQCGREMSQLPCPKFVAWHARRLVDFTPDTMFLVSRRGPRFYTSVARGIWEGATVTYVAMQIAHYLGFRKVILVGVDHSFETKGQPHATVISRGDDPNHFSPRYFGKGFRWQLPDLETSELAYRLAREQFERSGGEIVDATVGGKLQVFRRVPYESCFDV